jgi:hypothetical protein
MGEEKTFSYGSCEFIKISPPQGRFSAAVKKLNITIPFEEALKLNLAIDECIRKLNRYKRSTTKGKKAAVNLVVHLDVSRLSINES